MYDTRNDFDRLSAVGGFVKRWMHWGSHGAVLQQDLATNVDMPFIRCTKEEACACRLALTV